MTISNKKQTVLVVDDVPDNINILSKILREDYQVKAALNSETALEILAQTPLPDIILLDVMMPGTDGYTLCKALKADPMTRAIPVIFVTSKVNSSDEQYGLELGAVDYITKPISPPVVKARIKTHLALYDQNRELEKLVYQRTQALNDAQFEIVHRLGRAAELKDNETGLHVLRMSQYAFVLAKALPVDRQWAELVYHAAPMHDIGKIGIPDSILLKPDKLTVDEWKIMKQHPEIGASILGCHASSLIQMAREIALSHHEKWDGSGYPYGLKGEAIPLSGRVVAIVDVFDALTSECRPYKEGWSIGHVLQYIDKQKMHHFDPKLVDVFFNIMPDILAIREDCSTSDNV